ncbi:hypothetical protein [Novipirellula artificiosorum]|uniref:hypothetical protein n=1 Tax=Novipirellula artificiosorum TaxID=2528016 RepID=UPI0011B6EF28|nr:hypothetical protein [Novipirellula artificiosorum]
MNHLQEAVAALRDRALKAGVGNPYIVGMNSGGIWAAVYVDQAGLDAVSAYRGAFGSTKEGTPYAELWPNICKSFLESPCSRGDNSKRQLVVPLMSGANHTPRHEVKPEQFGAQHYLEPLPGEFMEHVTSGMDWVANHPDNCEADSVLIYAWNEHSEGGRICPTMGTTPEYAPNTRLLDELAQAIAGWQPTSSTPLAEAPKYADGRPEATLRMDAKDHGVVLRYGDGPERCDMLGARDVWVFEDKGTYYLHYDAAGPEGWLCSLAVSKDLLSWEKKGPILEFGGPGEDDSKSASYGVTFSDGKQWHMFYLGTPNVSAPPDRIPSFPYLTMKAKAIRAAGPWIKQTDVVPFRTKPDTYYSITASPGQVIQNGDEYLQFFSATTRKPGNPCQRHGDR